MMSPLWIAGTTRLWLAARGARHPLDSAYGRCYATLLSPSFYFARIGLSTETARWYALPLTWDATVVPSLDEFELLVNPVTGYVERLRRLGEAPVELRQEIQNADAPETPRERAETDTGKATPEQRRELYRTARREGLRWAINPAAPDHAARGRPPQTRTAGRAPASGLLVPHVQAHLDPATRPLLEDASRSAILLLPRGVPGGSR